MAPFMDPRYARLLDKLEMCGFFLFLKQYCTIAPTVLASVKVLAT